MYAIIVLEARIFAIQREIMRSRRRLFAVTLTSLVAVGAKSLFGPTFSAADEVTAEPATLTASAADEATAEPATPTASAAIWVPLVESSLPTPTPEPTATFEPEPTAMPELPPNDRPPTPTATAEPAPPAGDGALLGAATGSADAAVRWLMARPGQPYSAYDIAEIVGAYQRLGDAAGVDWFLALAQMCHETDHLRSWWAQRPRRNPAGIGVTGQRVPGTPDLAPNNDPARWAYRDGMWYQGVSFARWDTDAIAAQLGRLLAYALNAPQNEAQRQMIDWALYVRSLPAALRGAAPTIIGLNGSWAVPGTTYGQSIIALRDVMRDA